MIFVTVGSDRSYRFDRLIQALDQLSDCELVVQHGPAPAPARVKDAYQWLSVDEVLEFMRQADTVIGHAGAGTILCASRMGHVPVVMPRLKRFGELMDDHQAKLAAALEHNGRVTVVWDAASLAEQVARSPRRGSPAAARDGSLHAAVRSTLCGATS